MKKYIRATSQYDVDTVWASIPDKYIPYIDDIEIHPQYSVYRNKEVITYNVIFKPEVWGDKNPMVGLLYIEDIPTLVKSIQEYLDPIIK